MPEDKNINVSVVPKFAETVMENVLSEPSKSIGNTFSDIWFLVLGGPMGQLAEKRKMKYAKDLKEYKEKIEEEMNKVPNDKRCEADIQLVGRILESSKYCADKNDLRIWYSKLIAATTNIDKKNLVHPIFADIISKMTSVDTAVFNSIATETGCRMDINKYHVSLDEIYLSMVTLRQLGLITMPVIERRVNEIVDDYVIHPIDRFPESGQKGFDNDEPLLDIATERVMNDCSDLMVSQCRLTRLGKTFKQICID